MRIFYRQNVFSESFNGGERLTIPAFGFSRGFATVASHPGRPCECAE
ncbi:MAG TPA: hypothetical protein PLN56_01820 [Methanoregulaceae archaeon]|nr:hypothetical protein [Methanoregulaceae archaeon]HPD09726.1 hypothetical protein [Methanoregulaceae archaeon]HRT14553.1 hypothetical protein [Methanoregulaceae archaeon]HRU30124.1 hypothetical protein [Methanoregulaceae archaeon]